MFFFFLNGCLSSEIVEIKADQYEAILENNQNWFILYLVENCTECNEVYDNIKKISGKLSEMDARLGFVNCTQETVLCTRFESFPVFDTVRRGYNVTYTGKFTYEELLGHIFEIIQPAVRNLSDKLENSSFEEILDDYGAILIFILKEVNQVEFERLESFVASIYDRGIYMYIDQDEIHQLEDVNFKKKILEIQKNREKAAVIFRKGMADYTIYIPDKNLTFVDFVVKNLFEAVPKLNEVKNFTHVIKYFKYVFIYCPSLVEQKNNSSAQKPISEQKFITPNDQMLIKELSSLIPKHEDVFFSWRQYEKIYEIMFGIEQEMLPTAIIFEVSNENVYLYPKDYDIFSVSEIDSWVHDVVNHEIQALNMKERQKYALKKHFKGRPLSYIFALLRILFYETKIIFFNKLERIVILLQTTKVSQFVIQNKEQLRKLKLVFVPLFIALFISSFIAKTILFIRKRNKNPVYLQKNDSIVKSDSDVKNDLEVENDTNAKNVPIVKSDSDVKIDLEVENDTSAKNVPIVKSDSNVKNE